MSATASGREPRRANQSPVITAPCMVGPAGFVHLHLIGGGARCVSGAEPRRRFRGSQSDTARGCTAGGLWARSSGA
jgi:hypothetical protein